jgi:hypothetical protein
MRRGLRAQKMKFANQSQFIEANQRTTFWESQFQSQSKPIRPRPDGLESKFCETNPILRR